MIGKCFAYQSLHCDVLGTAEQQFQNGHRVQKMAARRVFAPCPHLPGSENGSQMGESSLTAEFSPHRNALNSV